MPDAKPAPTAADKWVGFLLLFFIIGAICWGLQAIGVVDEPAPAPRSACERSWDTYVANGRPNNLSRSAYMADCQLVRDAVAKASR